MKIGLKKRYTEKKSVKKLCNKLCKENVNLLRNIKEFIIVVSSGQKYF
jgi:hypothetical protein